MKAVYHKLDLYMYVGVFNQIIYYWTKSFCQFCCSFLFKVRSSQTSDTHEWAVMKVFIIQRSPNHWYSLHQFDIAFQMNLLCVPEWYADWWSGTEQESFRDSWSPGCSAHSLDARQLHIELTSMSSAQILNFKMHESFLTVPSCCLLD